MIKPLIVSAVILIPFKIQAQRKILISIGVDKLEYHDTDFEKFDRLKYPVSIDATRVTEKFSQLGYSVRFLPNPTSFEIKDTLNQVKNDAKSPDDIVLIYISSHGIRRFSSLGITKYILTKNSRIANLENTSVDVRYIRDFLDSLPSMRKASIIAACKSGHLDFHEKKGGDDLQESSEFLMASATNDAGYAREIEGKGDLYTHNLLSVMDNKIEDMTLLTAHLEASSLTVSQTNGEQRPSINAIIDGVDQIFVTPNRSGETQGVVRAIPDGNQVLLSGIRVKGGESIKFSRSGIKTLEVRDSQGGLLLSKQIEIKRGRDYLLNALMSGPPQNTILITTNSYYFSKQEVFIGFFHGVGFSYRKNLENLSFSLGLIYFHKESEVLYGYENYSAELKALQVPVKIEKPYLLKPHKIANLFISPEVKISSYFLDKKVDRNYFNNDSKGLFFSAEGGVGLFIQNNRNYFGLSILSGLHSNFESIRFYGWSFSFAGGVSW